MAFKELTDAAQALYAAQVRLDKSEEKGASEDTLKKNRRLLEQAKDGLAAQLARLDGAVTHLERKRYNPETKRHDTETLTLAQYAAEAGSRSYGYAAEPVFAEEASPLREQWNADLTVSRNMQAAAEKAMLQDAADVDGAFNADEMRGAMEGAFHVRGNGAMLFADMLADTADGVWAVKKDYGTGLLKAELWAADSEAYHMALPDMERNYPDAVFVRADTPEAVPALQKLAKREADLMAKRNGRLPEHLSLRQRFPQMAEFMPDEVKIRFRLPKNVAMKPPYFVRCLSDELLDGLDDRAPFEHLAAQQAFLNIEADDNKIWVDDESVFDQDTKVSVPMLLDSLKAHGVKTSSFADLAMLADESAASVAEHWVRAAVDAAFARTLEAGGGGGQFDALLAGQMNGLIAPYCTEQPDWDFLLRHSDSVREAKRSLIAAALKRGSLQAA